MMFTHTFAFRPWRLFPDIATGCWLVETRDPGTQTVEFHSFDPQKRAITPLPYPGPWACGITGVYGGVAVIHGYEAGSLPVRSGLWALGTQAGEVLWAMPDGFSCLGFLPDKLIVSHFSRPETLSAIHLHTGLPASDSPPDWQTQARAFAREMVPEMAELTGENGKQGIRWGKTEVWVEGNTVAVIA